MNEESIPQTAGEVEKSLQKLRNKRGYLLPHHGLLAISSPNLLDAYDDTYTHMTLTDRVLSLYEKEVVWLIILVSTSEAIATHHIDRLRRSGGGEIDLEAAIAAAACRPSSDRPSWSRARCCCCCCWRCCCRGR